MSDPDEDEVKRMFLKSLVYGSLRYFRHLLFGPALPLALVGFLLLLWSIYD